MYKLIAFLALIAVAVAGPLVSSYGGVSSVYSPVNYPGYSSGYMGYSGYPGYSGYAYQPAMARVSYGSAYPSYSGYSYGGYPYNAAPAVHY